MPALVLPHISARLPPPAAPPQITAEEYAEAAPDPIYQFSAPVAGHMNADHADATRAMVKHYVGITGAWGRRLRACAAAAAFFGGLERGGLGLAGGAAGCRGLPPSRCRQHHGPQPGTALRGTAAFLPPHLDRLLFLPIPLQI